jgi:hypothetical protein
VTADCVTLWIGASLGPVERACLRSVLRQGHRHSLYCYDRPHGVPDGIEVRDASEILPESEVFFHRNGSVAIFADWFRYELQRRNLGTWVDTDVYLLRPLDGERPYLFGLEEPNLINNAVLRIPPDCPLLAELLKLFEARTLPGWLPWRANMAARAGALMSGGKVDFARLPFGTTGPDALTAIAERLGLASEALPSEVFNPVAWWDAGWIRDPTITLDAVTTGRTVALHLWNECIKDFKDAPAPEGSFLARLQHEGR